MAIAKILLIGSALLLSSIASAKDFDDDLLEAMGSQKSHEVLLESQNQESLDAAETLTIRKYHPQDEKQVSDGMVVSLK